MALRFAVLLCRARRDSRMPAVEAKVQAERLRLAFDTAWLEANPLTAGALREELAEWAKLGHDIRIPGLDEIVTAQEPALAE